MINVLNVKGIEKDMNLLKTLEYAGDEYKKNVLLNKLPLGDFLEAYSECQKESAVKEGFLPLNIVLSVRSLYTNMCIVKDTLPVLTAPKVLLNDVEHRGYDFVMYCASRSMFDIVETDTQEKIDSFNSLMMEHSSIHIMGLCIEESSANVYCHVFLSDEGIKLIEPMLKVEYDVLQIKNAEKKKPYTDTLKIVHQ